MCGFVGYLGSSVSYSKQQGEAILEKMADQIISRGPDDSGYWYHPEKNIGLGHRRLSIIDLSPAGHQPMQSPSGRYTISFNGEIYNHTDLRKQLSSNDIHWRGHSDTEALLAGFDAWGIEATVKRTIGMFAFAVWDNNENTLVLGRDRIGEKPLYYGWQGDTFLFSSELKALKQHPDFKAKINRDAIPLLLRHNYIPAPYSIYQGISKLEPGCLLSISSATKESKVWSYWSSSNIAVSGVQAPFTGTPNDAVDELERLAKDAIGLQMISDVPLGAFLSGGIDSSAVVALMQAQSTRPVKTFTIGFHEEGYNEAVHAKAVAKHLGTNHTELYVTAEEATSVIPDLPTLYSEPFSDSSQIPTFLVSKLAKQHVSVSLSGDAGDELFCGYGRYQLTNKLWNKFSILPMPFRIALAKGINNISPQMWGNIGHKLHKGAGLLTSRTVDELYLGLVSHHSDPAVFVIGATEPSTLLSGNTPNLTGLSDIQRIMALDLETYLPDDILVKVDRAAMGVSLETRVPFLDQRIIEFAWSLPQSIKLKDDQTKWPLRQVLYRYVPKKLIERPKMGFGIPLDKWLRGPLRDWAESLLDEDRLRREGFFHPRPIRVLWSEHLLGTRNWVGLLWSILMFQAWLEENENKSN
jgi:asparagine synthase (glutamine-hydrolysing)